MQLYQSGAFCCSESSSVLDPKFVMWLILAQSFCQPAWTVHTLKLSYTWGYRIWKANSFLSARGLWWNHHHSLSLTTYTRLSATAGGRETSMIYLNLSPLKFRTLKNILVTWRLTTTQFAVFSVTWKKSVTHPILKRMLQWSGRTLGIINWNPSGCKSNRLHVDILRFFLYWIGAYSINSF